MKVVEKIARAIADADDGDYMEDCQRYDKRAKFAVDALSNLFVDKLASGNYIQVSLHGTVIMHLPYDVAFRQVTLS